MVIIKDSSTRIGLLVLLSTTKNGVLGSGGVGLSKPRRAHSERWRVSAGRAAPPCPRAAAVFLIGLLLSLERVEVDPNAHGPQENRNNKKHMGI